MSRRMLKHPRARMVALAVGVGVLGSLAPAPASFAGAPAAGIDCQASDGKITGRGSTFQEAAQQLAFIPGFQAEVCGAVAQQSPLTGPGTFSADPAGSHMVDYNDYVGPWNGNPEPSGSTGSGQGLATMRCRGDAFGGTDLPYSESQLHGSGAAGSGLNAAVAACPNPVVLPPYTPGTPYPNLSDATDPAMSIPIAGGGVGFGYNLGPATCTTPANLTSKLNFTSQEAQNIWDGADATWNSADLVATNPELGAGGANCTGQIIREARSDNSGTTGIVMTYLGHINTSLNVCGTGKSWSVNPAWLPNPQNNFAYTNNPNNVWPAGAGCAAGQPTESQGTPGVIAATLATDGAIGYGEVGLWAQDAPTIPLANLQDANSFHNGNLANFQPAGVGNCTLGGNGLPGGTPADSVGLNGSPAGSGFSNWADDAQLTSGVTNKEDQTFVGSGYPVCALTFALVYKNTHVETPANNPALGLTNDQRQTLYAYIIYVLSPGAQLRLGAQGYDNLPVNTWLPSLRSGFTQNF